MGRAAVGEEGGLVGICAVARPCCLDACAAEALKDVARQVEHGVALAGRRHEPCVAFVRVETVQKLRANLVICLTDRRAKHCDDVGAVSTQAFHRIEGGLEHAADRALPTGMSRADHTRFRVGEQHGSAIGCHDADGQTGHGRDDRIASRLLGDVQRERLGRDVNGGGMDLIGRHDIAEVRAKRVNDAHAVLTHMRGGVLRSDADVEPSVDAFRHAAATGKETVHDGFAAQFARLDRIQLTHDVAPASGLR